MSEGGAIHGVPLVLSPASADFGFGPARSPPPEDWLASSLHPLSISHRHLDGFRFRATSKGNTVILVIEETSFSQGDGCLGHGCQGDGCLVVLDGG